MYMESEWVKTFINDAVEKQQDRIILGQEQEKQAKKKKRQKITLRLSSVGYGAGQSCHRLAETGSQGPWGICETVDMMLSNVS